MFGVDLDGVCADFYARMREIAAEWLGVTLESLPVEVSYGLDEWGLTRDDYRRLHRFAVTQRDLFRSMAPIAGAPQALRRLSKLGVRIRIITHRLFIPYFHQPAAVQTVQWLEYHNVPYWDLCFMAQKGAVGADIYIDDAPENVEALSRAGKPVIIFTNSTNRDIETTPPKARADTWDVVERLVRARYEQWCEEHQTRPDSAVEPEGVE